MRSGLFSRFSTLVDGVDDKPSKMNLVFIVTVVSLNPGGDRGYKNCHSSYLSTWRIVLFSPSLSVIIQTSVVLHTSTCLTATD